MELPRISSDEFVLDEKHIAALWSCSVHYFRPVFQPPVANAGRPVDFHAVADPGCPASNSSFFLVLQTELVLFLNNFMP